MSIINFSDDDRELEIEPALHGPFRPRSLADHQWEFEAGTEGLSPTTTLTCLDPCSLPYDYHSGQLCCCQWLAEADSIDHYLSPIRVTLTREDHTGWNYWGDDYEPGWIKVTPVAPDERNAPSADPHGTGCGCEWRGGRPFRCDFHQGYEEGRAVSNQIIMEMQAKLDHANGRISRDVMIDRIMEARG